MLERLLGVWELERNIVELDVRVSGQASFSARADGLVAYAEQGILRSPTADGLEVRRRYLFGARPAGFEVFFDETPPRSFHVVDLVDADEGLVGEATHLCGDDQYVSRYVFADNDAFSIRHTVSGPAKSYVLMTSYRRS